MISPKILQILRESLPSGYGRIISARLKDKGKEVHFTLVYKVLKGERSNLDIINEALAFAEEIKLSKEKIDKRILALK